jgi:hypothetical protein
MPRQAERTKPTTFDSFTDVRITTSSSLESVSQHASLFASEDDLDDDTRDRLGLLRSDEQGDGRTVTTTLAAGGGMRQGKPFTSLSSNSSSSLPISGVINSNPDQLQQTAEILAAQDETLDKLSANLGRLQNITAEITTEMTTQEVVTQEVSSITERAENAVDDVTRQVDGIVKRYNAESMDTKSYLGITLYCLGRVFYLIYF